MAQYIAITGLDRSARVRVPGWIAAAENEVQHVDLDGAPSSGTFSLTYAGEDTDPLDFDATTTEVDDALEALSTIGVGNVAVTGVAGAWIVTFTGDLAGTDVEELTATDIDLEVGEEGVTVTTATPGDDIDRAPVALAAGVVAIVDVDRADVRAALGDHSSIGQYAVVAANDDIHGTALPTNT